MGLTIAITILAALAEPLLGKGILRAIQKRDEPFTLHFGPAANSGGSAGSCTDTIPNCKDYGNSVCSNQQYSVWVKEHCPSFCHKCSMSSGSGMQPATVQPNFHNGLDLQIPEGSCTDSIPNCKDYGDYVCSDQTYAAWVKEKCPAFCRTCSTNSGPGMTPSGQNGFSGSSSGCVYKGHVYSRDQTWKDGCQFRCTCNDASSGKYTCTEMCVKWNLPGICHMQPAAPGKCCGTPICPDYVNILYPPGYIQE